MSFIYMQRENIRCVATLLAKAISKVLHVDENYVFELINTGKIRVQPTPDPMLGDYGFAIHVLLKNVDRAEWDIVGSSITRELLASKEQCNVENASFINGYVNVTFNYSEMLIKIATDWYTGELNRRLLTVGKGTNVIVEHTSANPVHPLHIGSGRNSVIGDTYARLLRRLGFNVKTRFYVNDLGRQVAILAYGVSIVRSKGIEKPVDIKVDHWYGAIYALTNISVELNRLKFKLRDTLYAIVAEAEKVLEKTKDIPVDAVRKGLIEYLKPLVFKRGLNANILKQVKSAHKFLNEVLSSTSNEQVKSTLAHLLELLNEFRSMYSEYLTYVKAEARLAYLFPELHLAVKSSIKNYVEAEDAIKELMIRAERGDPDAVTLFRGIAEDVLNGFKETLSQIGISFDGFDYESSDEVVKLAHAIVEELLKTPYARLVNGAVEVDLNSAAEAYEYVKNLFYPDQPGRFIVRRSDGTTLYVTRDIAYTVHKFRSLGADEVYNVIAVEQSREQKQLKAVLYILGFKQEAEKLHHFGYEMVHLKGMRMSGRRGIYYTLDELLMDAESVITKKLAEKEPGINVDSDEVRSLAKSLAVANVRALLLSVEPSKVLVFDTEKIETTDYASILEYALVRAQSILRNLWNIEPLDNVDLITTELRKATEALIEQRTSLSFTTEEKTLLEHLLGYEYILLEAYRDLKPNKILEYAVELSLSFNKFYEKYPVIKEPDTAKRLARIVLTVLTLLTLSELMDILGMPKLRRM
ncbi:MAG: arginine--tRNA ligase [Desulfurococcaceae archaeon]